MNYKKLFAFALTVLFCTGTFAQALQLKLNNVTVKQAMSVLKQKSGYSFVYEGGDINAGKTVSVDAKSLQQAIGQILKDQKVSYEIKGKNIVVSKKQESKTGKPSASKKTVTGVIVDAKGEAIIGATIKENGTKNATVTDFDGNFTLSVSPYAILDISSIGYTSKHVKASNQPLRIVLSEDFQNLNEVIVVGYGTQRKGDVTSAITSIKAKDFLAGKTGDAADLIKGKVAGLSIANGSGDPNATSTIRLRGVISVNGSTTPLVLVDGIEGNLQTVSPETIESIDVLKDASAAAIYGTRGANGVILITTKSGKREQKTTASYASYMSVSNFGKKLEFMNAADVKAGKTDFKDLGADTDWLSEISRTGFTHNHNVNITGGNKQTSYSADFTYRYENGVIKKTYAEDMHARFDLSHWMFNDILKLNFNFIKRWHRNSATNASNGSFTNIYRQAIERNPTAPVYNEDGSYYEDFGINEYYNPIEMINERQGKYTTEQTRLTGNFTIEPIRNWKTNIMLSTNRSFAHNRGYNTKDYWECVFNGYNGYAYQEGAESKTDNLELTTKYDFAKNKHRVNALAGYSYQYYDYESYGANNKNFPTDFFSYNNLGIGTYLKDGKAGMSSSQNDNKLIGFFARVSYAYNNRYNLLLSVRREGSSKFGDNHKWGTFPAASAGWTISEENFMKAVQWVNHLKLRIGFGVTGVIPNSSYQSLTKYTYGGSYYLNENDEWVQGLQPASNPNTDLRWEKSTEYNLGLDFSLAGDRIGGSIDVYHKKTKDLLFWYSVPTPPNLYNSTFANGGSVRNTGIEISLNATPVRSKDFEWKTVVTASHNSNKLLSLSNGLYESNSYMYVNNIQAPISTYTHRMEEGRSIGEFYGLKSVGVSENGLFMVEKPDGEQVEFKSAYQSNDEYCQYLGNGLPKVYLGWNNTITYKNWDLSMQMTGQFGFKILNLTRAYWENNSIPYNRLKSVEKAPYGGAYTLSVSQVGAYVSYYLENGDFLKMTNMTLGYTIPLRENKYIKHARLYLSANNLFCITGYEGLDPELSNASPIYAGVDSQNKYPTLRSFTLGLNVTF